MTDAPKPGPRVAIAGVAVRGAVADAALGRQIAQRLGGALAARDWPNSRAYGTIRLRIAEGASDAQIRAALAHSLGGSDA